MIKSLFNSGHLLKEINRRYITLVPKTAHPGSVNHYRPISFCNISYKIISKTLANRLKFVLPKVISPLHGAFIEGREFHDNILVAHEILISFSKKGINRDSWLSNWI